MRHACRRFAAVLAEPAACHRGRQTRFDTKDASMTQPWCTLTNVDGRAISAPTPQQLTAALAEVYNPSHRPPPDAEPASAALRFGYHDGLMYVAEVSSDGALSFEEWSDRDCEMALAAPRQMRASKKQALEVWEMMCRRQVSKIRELPWQSGA
jgi:hypothetical protein